MQSKSNFILRLSIKLLKFFKVFLLLDETVMKPFFPFLFSVLSEPFNPSGVCFLPHGSEVCLLKS